MLDTWVRLGFLVGFAFVSTTICNRILDVVIVSEWMLGDVCELDERFVDLDTHPVLGTKIVINCTSDPILKHKNIAIQL